jgi:hypothetical protein
MFRRWALDWLRADLTAYVKLSRQNNPAMRQTIQERLTHWRSNPGLAPVREPQELNRMLDNERTAWQALWRDVDELQSRVAKQDEPIKGHKEAEAPKAKTEGCPRQLPQVVPGGAQREPARSALPGESHAVTAWTCESSLSDNRLQRT